MSTKVQELTEKIKSLEDKCSYLESLLNSFWTGHIPNGASLGHMILAKSGRERLEKLRKKPVLLTDNKLTY
jgi:hypothetical protein